MKKMLVGALLAGAMMAAPASAAVVQADFWSGSDLPDYSAAGPLVYQNVGAILGPGYELNDSHFVQNPSGWGGGVVFVDWNASTNIITLDSQDDWDFQTYELVISNVLFDSAQSITGITLLTNDLTTTGLVPTLSFTGNSVTISYAVSDLFETFNFTGGSATFEVILDGVTPAVPEPATWAMMILGFGIVGTSMRRRSASKVNVSFA